MAITVNVKEENSNEKETNLRSAYWTPILFGISIVTLLAVLLYVLYSYIEIGHLQLESKRLALEKDEIKIRLYILESDYYLDEIDKEESKLEYITNDFNKIMRFASTRKPECVNHNAAGHSYRDIDDLEKSARNNIKYFKHILNSWIANLDYMDLDHTLNKLLSEYEEIFFNQGDWKDGKVDSRLKKFKEFYDSKVLKLEECTTPSTFEKDVTQKLQLLREKMKAYDEEIEMALSRFEKLDEEIIKSINRMAFENIMCLGNFPDMWENIQKEKILADQALAVLKFKLKRMRYILMAADSPEKVDQLVKWEEEFSKKIADNITNNIDNHYKIAVTTYNASLKDIHYCLKTNNSLY